MTECQKYIGTECELSLILLVGTTHPQQESLTGSDSMVTMMVGNT